MRVASIVVVGAGRMGKAVLACAGDTEHRIVAVVRRTDVPVGAGGPPVYTDIGAALRDVAPSVVLDFSSARDAEQRIRTVAGHGCPLVEGTTALDAGAMRALVEASARIPVVEAPNTSPGLARLGEALERILRKPRTQWDIAVTDRHHRDKKDAPSGTALFLARLIAGITGREPAVASYRQGGVVGEHTIHLSGTEEELVLVHRALDRSVFARGALLAAGFAAAAPPGHYGMRDALG